MENYIGKKIIVDMSFDNITPVIVEISKLDHMINVAGVVINEKYFLGYSDFNKNLQGDNVNV